MGRVIDSINFTLTTNCNMACPDCCAGITAMPKKNRKFYDWAYMENAAKYFKGMRRINLTGGEPTIHPKFSEWAPKLKDLFACEVLSVWTNGTMFRKKTEAFKYFDEIHITNYTKETFEGSPDNSEEIDFIKSVYPDKKISHYKAVHIPLEKRGSKMCFRGKSETVEFVDGFVYPCSSSSGLPTQIKVTLSDNWKEEVLKLYPPCHECLFAI